MEQSNSHIIFRSKKGFEKLAHDGYLYNLDKRNAYYTLWRCELSKKPGHKCSGRARLTDSVIEVYTNHSHPQNKSKMEADILKSKIYEAATNPDCDSKCLLRDAAQFALTGSKGLPKLCSIQRVISRKRRSTQRLCKDNSSASMNSALCNNDLQSESVEALLNSADQLQMLFTPSGGVVELEITSNKVEPSDTFFGEFENSSPSKAIEQSNSPNLNRSDQNLLESRMSLKNWLGTIAQKSGIVDLTSYELALTLDEKDSLYYLRDYFHYPKMETLPNVDLSLVNPKEDSIYLCGNSLGLMPKRTKEIMDEQLQKWADMGVYGHTESPIPWSQSDEHVLCEIAKLVGAEPSEIACMNSLTVNLHILLTSFYQPTQHRNKILIESKAFPSDHYAIESQIRLKGFKVEESLIYLEPRKGEDSLRKEDIISKIESQGDQIFLIFLSGIHYYTGQLFDIKAITETGHSKGCLVGWDLAHVFGNVPICLHDWQVDFACWCTYKYVSSSAGGIGCLFIHKRFENDKRKRMSGWWGHKCSTRFIMDNCMDLEVGASGYRISNPPMLLIPPLKASLEIFSLTSIHDLRAKSLMLTGYLEFLILHFLSATSLNRRSNVICTIITPSDPEERGCQLSLRFNANVKAIHKELKRRGVVVDVRHPDVIRVTPVHLYNSFSDVHRFMRALLDAINQL